MNGTDEDYAVVQAMLTYGGSFVQALAAAAQAADAVNLAKLKATWPDYWTKYAELAKGRGNAHKGTT